jgi:SAM-dependent methyltransferase
VASSGDKQFYSDELIVASFASTMGWQHPGEASVLVRAAPEVRGKRVLDIGVGGGRTVPLLLLMTDRYVGIDYAEPMVAACRKRFPGLTFSVGDARVLEEFSDASFDFVFFSYNGIDTVTDEERQQVYRSVHRVLSPEGLFAFSTLNMAGRTYGEKPFQLHRPGEPVNRSLRAAANSVLRNTRRPGRLLARQRQWKAAQRAVVVGDGWATNPLAATDFNLFNHFVTLPRLRQELETGHFDVLGIYGSEGAGELIPASDPGSKTDSFYCLVRKR